MGNQPTDVSELAAGLVEQREVRAPRVVVDRTLDDAEEARLAVREPILQPGQSILECHRPTQEPWNPPRQATEHRQVLGVSSGSVETGAMHGTWLRGFSRACWHST